MDKLDRAGEAEGEAAKAAEGQRAAARAAEASAPAPTAPATTPTAGDETPKAAGPDRVARGRIRIIGGVLIALAVLQLGGVAYTLTHLQGVYEGAAEADGGELTVVARNATGPAAGVRVDLLSFEGKPLANGTTDALGRVTLATAEAGVEVRLALDGQGYTRRAFVPEDVELTVTVLAGSPLHDDRIVAQDVAALQVVVGIVPWVVLLAGGAAMLALRLRPFALVACAVAAVQGLMLLLGMNILMAIPVGGIGVWGFLLVRRHAGLFGPLMARKS